jgi:dTMP kinase
VVTPDAATVPTPVVTPEDLACRGGGAPATTGGSAGAARASAASAPASPASPASPAGPSDAETTAELPQPPAPSGEAGADDETAVLRPVPPGAADETAVLPPVPQGAADETAVLPPVREEDPADRVPQGFFRDEPHGTAPGSGPDDGGTREMPRIDPDEAPRRRQRSDWAEETPLDDLPTLADELLGPYRDEDDHDDDRRRGRRR